MAKLLIESGYDGAPFRREVDARPFYEMFDHCVSQHEAFGVLAVIQFRMFAPTWPSVADSTNVQVPVQHCCIRVCSDIVEVVTTLMGCPRAR